MKATIFSAATLFALTLLGQPSVYGQTPPPPVNKATAPPTIKAKEPQDEGRKTTPPSMADKLGFKDLPDLQITEMKIDKPGCAVLIRVANEGSMDAGAFNVWMNGVGGYLTAVGRIKELARGKDAWVKFLLMKKSTKTTPYKCVVVKIARVQAVVDARYLYKPGMANPNSDNDSGFLGLNEVVEGLIKHGSPVPAGMKVAEPQVKEANENNNELVVNIADMKPYP